MAYPEFLMENSINYLYSPVLRILPPREGGTHTWQHFHVFLGVNVIDLYQVLCHRDPFLGLSPIIFVSCLEKKPSSGCEFALHLQFLRLQYSLTRQDLVFTISLIEVAELSLLASGGICFLRMNPHMSLQCLWKTNVMMKLLVNEGNNKHTSAKCFPNCLI